MECHTVAKNIHKKAGNSAKIINSYSLIQGHKQDIQIWVGSLYNIFGYDTRFYSNRNRKFFQALKEKVFSTEGESIMTDFELAMRNALRTVYPNTALRTCWFHF